ncbi:alpha-L-fucosidase [Arenibacter sp. M-2]|uniref:alpha-L-fucosidase n=1 Tax=Arenibacter sp. M-2 TaxID=3053612 RepID=UPI00256FCEC5|nr:alpha-L-fucosidase [Arenibacter sp. M-2]MDL5511197.1 alpha-L-fucosidase [Arenibacter sp. M-2]
MKKMQQIAVLLLILIGSQAISQDTILNLNKPEREAWFTELGFGMFIHWSMDVQLGMVISHSMVGASDDYLDRYVNELPKTFNPDEFDASEWARAAKLAGMKYVVFTTKHHNGFCMFDTETTNFDIMNTPYAKDITRQVVDAFRAEGLAIGFYYSPDDFYFLYEQGTLISRDRPEALASGNKPLYKYVKEQMEELMTKYGKIDIIFLDGREQYAKTELAKVCWKIDPDVVVTRGAMETPEQFTPDQPLPAPWEANYTFGDQWQYRPTNETYKKANDCIEKLIDIRAKGGNFLLNFGPDEKGLFPEEQAAGLNEVSLWTFINREAFVNTEPLDIVREDNIWFLKKKLEHTVYAFLVEESWPLGERKVRTIKSLKAGKNAKISVLGQNSKVLEYNPDADPTPMVKNTNAGLEISVMRSHRIYNDRKWPNPIVVKLEDVVFNHEKQ